MTKKPWPTWDLPENFDPNAFMDSLRFDPALDDEYEIPPLPEPGEPVKPIERTVTIAWDAQVDWRVQQLAAARGLSVPDLLAEWAELEIARVDAQAVRDSRRRGNAA